MKKILSLLFIFSLISNSSYSQDKKASFNLIVGMETSIYKHYQPYIFSSQPKVKASVNYNIGGIFSYRLGKTISVNSGLSLLKRENKYKELFNDCQNGCTLLATFAHKRYYLLETPLNLRFQKQLNPKFYAFFSGGFSSYLNLFTSYIYKRSRVIESIKYFNYYGYSVNTATGFLYQLSQKSFIGLELNSRLYEKYRQEEILYGDPSKFNTFDFENINVALSFIYKI